jgi:hypothetical protein
MSLTRVRGDRAILLAVAALSATQPSRGERKAGRLARPRRHHTQRGRPHLGGQATFGHSSRPGEGSTHRREVLPGRRNDLRRGRNL